MCHINLLVDNVLCEKKRGVQRKIHQRLSFFGNVKCQKRKRRHWRTVTNVLKKSALARVSTFGMVRDSRLLSGQHKC